MCKFLKLRVCRCTPSSLPRSAPESSQPSDFFFTLFESIHTLGDSIQVRYFRKNQLFSLTLIYIPPPTHFRTYRINFQINSKVSNLSLSTTSSDQTLFLITLVEFEIQIVWVLQDNSKIGFFHGSWWSIKDLKDKQVLFTSKVNCGSCFSNFQGSMGLKWRYSQEDFSEQKIEGLASSLRFEDLVYFPISRVSKDWIAVFFLSIED